jgi:tRNA modification GTPase
VLIQANGGRGLTALTDRLTEFVQQGIASPDATLVTNARHHQHLRATDEALARAIAGLDAGISADWLAQDLRVALRELGAITGEIVTDDLLESIFSRFCIGK